MPVLYCGYTLTPELRTAVCRLPRRQHQHTSPTTPSQITYVKRFALEKPTFQWLLGDFYLKRFIFCLSKQYSLEEVDRILNNWQWLLLFADHQMIQFLFLPGLKQLGFTFIYFYAQHYLVIRYYKKVAFWSMKWIYKYRSVTWNIQFPISYPEIIF